jgi:serine/threonine protein kinase
MGILQEFAEEFKYRRLDKISDLIARNLVSQMLTRDPTKRPSMSQILAHPFLSGNNIRTRQLGAAPEYDVFICYQSSSSYDSEHAKVIHDALVAAGVNVWWDKKSLSPGMTTSDACFEY